MLRVPGSLVIGLCLVVGISCSKDSNSGTAPTPPPTAVAPRLTAPAPDGPGEAEQLSTLRPTLTVKNGTSDQTGTRTYEFQVSDRTDFAVTASSFASSYAVVVAKTGVPEGTGGSTSYTVETDLQPTTRLYWRARLVQGSTASEWSASRSFKSKLVGYNRPGELYDPLIHGETIGTPVGSTTFVTGKGIRVNDMNSFVRYQLAATISNGEFSAEVEGLYVNGPGAKMKVLSMMNGMGNLFTSKYLLNVQYRGRDGNPDNAIAFKALFGDEDYKLEPDLGRRQASVMALDPTRTYLWKAIWNREFRLIIQDGGIGGPTIYDYGITSPGGSYDPAPHFAYLGANNGPYGEETGGWPGAIYRNVWIGNRPRPASLGSALRRE